MKVTFVCTTQDRYTQNERYMAGVRADIRSDYAAVLVQRGDAVAGWGGGKEPVQEGTPPAAVDVPEPVTDKPAEDAPDYAAMTVAKLRQLADERGVDGHKTMRKFELVAALEDAE